MLSSSNININKIGNNPNRMDDSIKRNDPIQLDTGSDDDVNIMDTLFHESDREVSVTSEEGSTVGNNASTQVANLPPPSSLDITIPTTTTPSTHNARPTLS